MSDDLQQSEDLEVTELSRREVRQLRRQRHFNDSVEEINEPQVEEIEQPVEQLVVLTDDEVLMDGAGDEGFLQHALQFKDRPDRYHGDFKFITRLAARRARRRNQITAAEHEQVLSLIRKPIRLHKETRKPFNAWGEFENQVRAQMPKEMAAKSGFDWSTLWKQIVEWLKENWMTVLKIALSVLLMVI